MAAQQAEILVCTGKWQHEHTVQPWGTPPKRCLRCKAELIHISGPRLVGKKKERA